ncbi:radical SAM protein, partial [Sesbania bispinosa]
ENSIVHFASQIFALLNRFTIKVLVFDGKDLAYLNIQHEDIENLLQVSCEKLLESIPEPDYFPYPSVFNTLLGQ